MHRRRFLLAATALFASPALAAATDPVDIVKAIYKFSAGKKGDYSGKSALSDQGMLKTYFSKAFQAALAKMEKKSQETNEPILDFDPITASQDPSVKRLSIAATADAGKRKSVVATFFYADDSPTPTLVNYLFVEEAGGWKIDDITGATDKDKWSVRDIIK